MEINKNLLSVLEKIKLLYTHFYAYFMYLQGRCRLQ